MTRLLAALALATALPLAALADTPWDVQTGPDTWEKNPACTGQCEKDRAAAMAPDRPKPGAPVQVPGDKPQKQRLTADGSDREATPGDQVAFSFCCLHTHLAGPHKGKTLPTFHTAAGRGVDQARQDCKARAAQPKPLAICPAYLSTQIEAARKESVE